MAALRAISTVYSGVEFRSRIEARWALLFTEFHVRWDYEQEGYDLDGTWYLPDFWLPDVQAFAEVKGGRDQWDKAALTKAAKLSAASHRTVLLLDEIRASNWTIPAFAGTFTHVDLLNSVSQGKLIFCAQGQRPNEIGLVPAELLSRWRRCCERARSARFDRREAQVAVGEEVIEAAMKAMLSATTAEDRRIAGEHYTALIQQRNARRTDGEVHRLERQRGLR